MIKIYSDLALDISTLGLAVYTWLSIHLLDISTSVEIFEKFILFLCTVGILGYRIYIYHLDAEEKKIKNANLREDLKERRNKSA